MFLRDLALVHVAPISRRVCQVMVHSVVVRGSVDLRNVRSCLYCRTYMACSLCTWPDDAETQDRTGDLQIFSLTLSQLSYRGSCEFANVKHICLRAVPTSFSSCGSASEEPNAAVQKQRPQSLRARRHEINQQER